MPSIEMHHDLETIWPVLQDDPASNVIILTGAGRAFSAGGDIQDLISRFDTEAGRAKAFSATARARRIVDGILNVRKPIIAAVNGDAMVSVHPSRSFATSR